LNVFHFLILVLFFLFFHDHHHNQAPPTVAAATTTTTTTATTTTTTKEKKPWAGYRGEWQPYLRNNHQKEHNLVPNNVYPSNHFPLLAKFKFADAHLSGLWHGGK